MTGSLGPCIRTKAREGAWPAPTQGRSWLRPVGWTGTWLVSLWLMAVPVLLWLSPFGPVCCCLFSDHFDSLLRTGGHRGLCSLGTSVWLLTAHILNRQKDSSSLWYHGNSYCPSSKCLGYLVVAVLQVFFSKGMFLGQEWKYGAVSRVCRQ